MKKLNVKDRLVQYPNRYLLRDSATDGHVVAEYDFEELTGTVIEEGTEINAELFNIIDENFEELAEQQVNDATETVKGIATLGSAGGAAKYEDVETLKEQVGDLTYKTPTTSLSLTGQTATVDLTADSLTRTITGFSHKETNIENIQGQLEFKYGSTTKKVNKSSSSVAETLSPPITVTFSSSVRSATFTISGTSVKNVGFSDSVTISSYYPSFYGALDSKPTADTISTLTKTSSAAISGTRTVTISGESKTIWFCTTGSISKITSSGFDVPFKQDGTLTYKGGSYKLYKTSNAVVAGTHTFTIS